MAGGTFVPELVEDDLIHCKYSEKKGLEVCPSDSH